MTEHRPALVPRTPFADLPALISSGCGLIVDDRVGLGLATVLVRKGNGAALAERVREHFRIELPQKPHRAAGGNLAMAGTGVGTWLATFERGGNTFAASLRQNIGDLASVSDQTDGYSVLRLTGPRVRDSLCKLVPVDVHPRVFKIGAVAVTTAAHIGVTLWRLDDHDDDSPVFEIAVFRSMAVAFWHALREISAFI